MKLRTDFVTNSSSVSYIVTMDLDIVDLFIRNFQESENMKGTIRLAEALKAYLIEMVLLIIFITMKSTLVLWIFMMMMEVV